MIKEIHNETDYPVCEIERMFEAMEFVIQDILCRSEHDVTIRLFNGMSINKDMRSAENSNLSKGGNIKSNKLMYLSAKFTDYFKREINRLIKQNLSQ